MKHLKYALFCTVITVLIIFLIISIVKFLGVYTFLLVSALAFFCLLALISWYIEYEIKEKIKKER